MHSQRLSRLKPARSRHSSGALEQSSPPGSACQPWPSTAVQGSYTNALQACRSCMGSACSGGAGAHGREPAKCTQLACTMHQASLADQRQRRGVRRRQGGLRAGAAPTRARALAGEGACVQCTPCGGKRPHRVNSCGRQTACRASQGPHHSTRKGASKRAGGGAKQECQVCGGGAGPPRRALVRAGHSARTNRSRRAAHVMHHDAHATGNGTEAGRAAVVGPTTPSVGRERACRSAFVGRGLLCTVWACPHKGGGLQDGHSSCPAVQSDSGQAPAQQSPTQPAWNAVCCRRCSRAQVCIC